MGETAGQLWVWWPGLALSQTSGSGRGWPSQGSRPHSLSVHLSRLLSASALQSSSAWSDRSPLRSEGSAGCRWADRPSGDRRRRIYASKGTFRWPPGRCEHGGAAGRPELAGPRPSRARRWDTRHGAAESCLVVYSPPAPPTCRACAGHGDMGTASKPSRLGSLRTPGCRADARGVGKSDRGGPGLSSAAPQGMSAAGTGTGQRLTPTTLALGTAEAAAWRLGSGRPGWVSA